MVFIRYLLIALLLGSPAAAVETYDLIFRQGTLSDVPATTVLHYDRQVAIAANPDYSARQTGRVELNFESENMARLIFSQGEKHRVLGLFPATVGNPIIMYFVETVSRDVAQEAGGSPFYIRNRIKDALVKSAPIEEITVSLDGEDVMAKTITLHPFAEDKNRDRLGVYRDLMLTFTMSDDVPGWYSSLVASAHGKDDALGYTNALTLRPHGAGQ